MKKGRRETPAFRKQKILEKQYSLQPNIQKGMSAKSHNEGARLTEETGIHQALNFPSFSRNVHTKHGIETGTPQEIRDNFSYYSSHPEELENKFNEHTQKRRKADKEIHDYLISTTEKLKGKPLSERKKFKISTKIYKNLAKNEFKPEEFEDKNMLPT